MKIDVNIKIKSNLTSYQFLLQTSPSSKFRFIFKNYLIPEEVNLPKNLNLNSKLIRPDFRFNDESVISSKLEFYKQKKLEGSLRILILRSRLAYEANKQNSEFYLEKKMSK
ncbi:hypothetical protein BpHYR1_034297 [Brachionus plicatilis]|uniref:Uncharacterized protein n=1 Tax=Brachionus plicatilis TaxID=10195 RepID=A0A3M7RVE2_BRAPC|nr:hypothetical protein BpHYR1_034297 [Brachionus plicatilis]